MKKKEKFKKRIKKVEDMMERNIVRSLIHLEMNKNFSEEELEGYYDGGVNREALLNDTRRNIARDQRILSFVRENKDKIIEEYGDKELTKGDLTKAYKKPIGESLDPKGGFEDVEEDVEGQSSNNEEGSKQSEE